MFQTFLALALTFAFLYGLLVWDPFRHLKGIFGALGRKIR